jgi:DNA replication protein DnaC
MRIEQTRKLLSAGVLPSPAPTQDVEALRERLLALRLVFAAEALGDLLTDAVKTEWSAAAFLDALLRLELERQEERRIAQAMRISHLPTGPTIANFDFAFQPSVSRGQIETLATCQWIRDRQGLLLQGAPGVGKSHLAIALGMRAIESGFSVCFARTDELLHQLKKDAEISPARLKHKKYMASSLLIVDEFGYQTFDREESTLFFRVVNHRYRRGSIAITTNKGIASWPEVLADDEVLAGAILDRLLHSATVLNIQGRSYRLRDLESELIASQQGQATLSTESATYSPSAPSSLTPRGECPLP